MARRDRQRMTRPGDRRLECRPEFKGGAHAQALQYSSRPPMMFGQASFNQPPCAGLFCRRPCRALLPRFSRNGPADRGVEPDGSLRDLQRDRARGHTTTGGHHRPGHLARDRFHPADAYGPCHLEEHHPDLFWYGVHGVERSTPSCYLSIPDIATKRPGPGCLAGPRKGRYTPMNMPVSRGMFRLMPHVSRIRHGASRCLVPPSGLSLC